MTAPNLNFKYLHKIQTLKAVDFCSRQTFIEREGGKIHQHTYSQKNTPTHTHTLHLATFLLINDLLNGLKITV